MKRPIAWILTSALLLGASLALDADTPLAQLAARLAPTTATTAQNVRLMGHLGGPSYAVAVQGNHAYVGIGPEFAILDISAPTKPRRIGYCMMPDMVNDVVVSNGYAYVADGGGGLRVIDTSDPTRPAEIGLYSPPGGAWDIAVTGDYAYLVCGGDLQVVNVSDPTAPIGVGLYSPPGGAWDIAVTGDHAYVVCGGGGLRVVDVSDPTAPKEVGACDTDTEACSVAIAGNYAYVCTSFDLCVVDVSDPTAPAEVGVCGLLGDPGQVAVVGDYVYITWREFWVPGYVGGLHVANVSDPANPSVIGQCQWGYAWHVAVAGDYAYCTFEAALGSSGGLRVVDISNPTDPVAVGRYDSPWPTDIAAAGNYVYTTWGDIVFHGLAGGLKVLDVSDRANPFATIGDYDAWKLCLDVEVLGSYAYVLCIGGYAGSFQDLTIVDVSNPTSPTEVSTYKMPENVDVADMAVVGNHAYVAGEGLWIVDVSDPARPSEVSFYNTPENISDVAVAGDRAYVTGISGLQVVDVSDPTAPTGLGSATIPGDAIDVAMAGNYAYVAWNDDPSGGLTVVDVSDPTNPKAISSYNAPGRVYDMAVASDYAYVATSGGLRVIDVSNPAAPTEVGFYETPKAATEVAVADDYIYIAAGGSLLILRFGPSATITPSQGGTLVYTDTQGLTTTIQVPPAAITATTTLFYAPVSTVAAPPGQAFAGHAFDLMAYQNNALQPGSTFSVPVTVTICYSDADVRVVSDENELTLCWWDGNTWVDAATTCMPPSTYERNTANNTLSVSICRQGRYTLFGPTNRMFLPLVTR